MRCSARERRGDTRRAGWPCTRMRESFRLNDVPRVEAKTGRRSVAMWVAARASAVLARSEAAKKHADETSRPTLTETRLHSVLLKRAAQAARDSTSRAPCSVSALHLRCVTRGRLRLERRERTKLLHPQSLHRVLCAARTARAALCLSFPGSVLWRSLCTAVLLPGDCGLQQLMSHAGPRPRGRRHRFS